MPDLDHVFLTKALALIILGAGALAVMLYQKLRNR